MVATATESFRHGGGQGWQVEGDVMTNADVMAAALSLYRFVLLRQQAGLGADAAGAQLGPGGQAGRPPGGAAVVLVTHQAVLSTLREDLLPLRAAVVRLLQQQGRSLGPGGAGDGLQQGPSGPAGGREALEEWLALQRLMDVLERVVEIAERWPAPGRLVG
jgi:hypothetical protein